VFVVYKGQVMSAMSNWISYRNVRYPLRAGDRALDAMLRGGAAINFSCRKGSCRSCMLQVVSGNPGEKSQATLPQELREAGFFLPCCADGIEGGLVAADPDLSLCTTEAMVADKVMISKDILRLQLEAVTETVWRPGQSITLINPAGEARSYSITSRPDDYFLTLDIRVYEGGAVSSWLAGQVQVGDMLKFRGPSGDFVYDEGLTERPLLVVATGTGGGAALGLVRDALARGHAGPIHFYHGGWTGEDLYLYGELATFSAANLTARQIASRESFGGEPAARASDVALKDHPDLSGWTIFLCGAPDMVEAARIGALEAGAAMDQIISDPFESSTPYRPRDADKLRALAPDPEIWAALENGKLLSVILEDFYTRVYADPRLEPFFHRVTKSRAVEKQYAFLQDVFSGTKLYFGEKPFNAHHWMVISDELFDYREALFFATLRDHAFPEPLIARWAAFHEMFRREIVKSAPRGHMRKGVEHDLEGYQDEVVSVGTLCDSCGGEVNEGAHVRMHKRTGEIFCVDCASGHVHSSAA
jgi:NAD(P)H-flavin reductase/truncated hemoglobin YjbI